MVDIRTIIGVTPVASTRRPRPRTVFFLLLALFIFAIVMVFPTPAG
jgi:hypothetical protein